MRDEKKWRAERERAEAMRREKRGNAAAIREALVRCADIINKFGLAEIITTPMEVICDIEGIITAALSAPLRNCDLYTVGEALRKYGFPTKIKPWGEKEWLDFCEWLVSEVEGETKGE